MNATKLTYKEKTIKLQKEARSTPLQERGLDVKEFSKEDKQFLAYLTLMHLKVMRKERSRISHLAAQEESFQELLDYLRDIGKDTLPGELMEACHRLPNQEEADAFLCLLSVSLLSEKAAA